MRFRHVVAGPGRRGLAWLIDAFLRLFILFFLLLVVGFLSWSWREIAEASTGVVLFVLFLLEWGYGAFFEILFRGQTPGKAALSLRVVRADGSPAGVQDLLLRNLLRGADVLPVWALPWLPAFAVPTFAVGVLVMFLDPRLRRLGDLVGGTLVVQESRAHLRDTAPIKPPLTEKERAGLPLHLGLSAEERRVLEDFVRRRQQLGRARAEELAEMFAPTLKERVDLRAETSERLLVLAYAAMVRRRDE